MFHRTRFILCVSTVISFPILREKNASHDSQNRFHGPLMSCNQQFDKTPSRL